jgi:hypothetical protein
MGDFRIIIDAVGGHGQDRKKKDGETVNFAEGGASAPEVIAKALVSALLGSGCSVQSAKVIHWPADNYPESRDAEKQIVDDLLTGKRKGNF